jgi:hypothetical protein
MCWRCGAVRPYDGPQHARIIDPRHHRDGYFYRQDDGAIVAANEAADWEALTREDGFPAWDAKDAQGVHFFKLIEGQPAS